MYYLYIIYNQTIDKYYIGCTNNTERRLREHNSKSRGKRYTEKQDGEWILTYTEEYNSQSQARSRERYIKKQKSRVFIENLIIKRRKCARSSAG